MEPRTSARRVFAPWLHRCSFISLWMVSRQTSYSAIVPPPSPPPSSSCPVILEEAKEKVAVKATPLPPLQPPGSISEMRSDDTGALGEPPLPFLAHALWALTSAAAACWQEIKTALRLWNRVSRSHVKNGWEILWRAFNKCHVHAVCVSRYNQKRPTETFQSL